MQPTRVHGTAAPGPIAACLVALALGCGTLHAGTPLVCGNGAVEAGEECDDGNVVDGDGCTSQCRVGALCRVSDRPNADALSSDPATGTCYARYPVMTTFEFAFTGCGLEKGHLVTITDAAEQQRVAALVAAGKKYWIGATDDSNSSDAVFVWLTHEPWAYTAFAPGEPDDDVGSGGLGNCLAITPEGWIDTVCGGVGFVDGRICEFQLRIFADGFE